MEERRGRGRKRRAECEYEQEFQDDYPYFPSPPRSRQATKDLDEAESDDRSVEIICRVYRRLEQGELTREELEWVASELRLFERRKLRVEWIVERVGEYVRDISSRKAEGKNGDEMKQEIGASGRRRSSRERKEPSWHKDFCPSHLITTI